MLGNDRYWNKIKNFGIFSMVIPLLILLISLVLERKGFVGLVENYDVGMARIVQYILFAIGVLIFFFCDSIANFFANKLFVKDNSRLQENKTSYFAYTFIVMWLLNMISILGFIGYMMCSNISWLVLFVILNFSIQIRFFPSEKRFKKLIEIVTK